MRGWLAFVLKTSLRESLTLNICNSIFVVTKIERAALAWTWDPDKAKANRNKHGLSFETAVLVFDDPFHASRLDFHPDGDRWQSIGLVGSVLLLVVHTLPDIQSADEDAIGRIISARKATASERRAYEEGKF